MNRLLLLATVLATMLASACKAPSPSPQRLPAAEERPVAPYPLDAFEDGEGRLWLGSVGSGAFCWTQQGLQEFHAADGLMGERNMGFAAGPDGTLWFTSAEADMGGRSALVSWTEPGGFQLFPFPDSIPGAIEGVHFDAAGQIWLSGTAGIFQFDGATFTRFDVPGNRQPMAYTPHRWFEASDGRIWFGTPDRGLWVWDGEAFTSFTTATGLLTDNASVLCEDAEGQIWISCFSWHLPDSIPPGGVCRWNGTQMITFANTAGLHHNDVYSGHCDRTGAVWLGATGECVYRYDGLAFERFDAMADEAVNPDGFSFGINSISEDASGRLHFCFTGGLYHLTENGFAHHSRAHARRP